MEEGDATRRAKSLIPNTLPYPPVARTRHHAGLLIGFCSHRAKNPARSTPESIFTPTRLNAGLERDRRDYDDGGEINTLIDVSCTRRKEFRWQPTHDKGRKFEPIRSRSSSGYINHQVVGKSPVIVLVQKHHQNEAPMGYQLEIIHILLCVAFEVFTYCVLCFNLMRHYIQQSQIQYELQQQLQHQLQLNGN
uniref:Uncharacterized protein n=1 Tax=Anopheles farauti TaxID=69004 RepID=A0A182QU29_9DIPT